MQRHSLISLIIIISIFMIINDAMVFAQETRGVQTLIQENDENNDERVSKQEFAGPDILFVMMDQNKDGYIDKSEEHPIWYSAAHFIIIFDNDMDGKVSQKELFPTPWGTPQTFKIMDLNEDGYLELIEVPLPGSPAKDFSVYMQRYDVDRDGKVSKYELSGFPRHLKLHFHPNDKNNDGNIDESEYRVPGPPVAAKGNN